MSTHKKIDLICIAATLFTLALTALFMNGKTLGIASAVSEDPGGLFTANDLNSFWDASSATEITLSDSGSKISGSGAYVHNGDVYIVYAGRYVLTGGLSNGSVVVDADKTDQIWISLAGVSLHCEDGAAIRVEQAGHVFLTLAEDRTNAVTSGAEYDAAEAESGVDGAIYSRDDLTINGSGCLVIDGAYQHGIVCNDDLTITGGNITISAAQDGIHANDSVRIREASLCISAGDDGITVSNDDETAFFYMESGSITIPGCYEGIEAADITIAGGTVDITAQDDGINASGSGAGSAIRVTGGDVTITNPFGRDADGLDSNGSIYIEGGRLFISVSGSGSNSAIDYGSENGGECVISGGTVIACGGSMMAEGFDASSPQGFLMYSTSAAAGTTVSLTDSTGRELLSEEIPYGFSSLVLSAPGLSVGDVCTLTVGNVQEQVTIDNVSSSGFAAAGMFGGGMHGGRGFGGMSGGQDFPDRQDREPSEKLEGNFPTNGMAERPGTPPSAENGEPPDGIELPDGAGTPGGETPPDQKESPGNGERPFSSGNGQGQGDGTRSPRQDWGQTVSAPGVSPSNLSAETLILLGISVLALLAGLGIAIKIRR